VNRRLFHIFFCGLNFGFWQFWGFIDYSKRCRFSYCYCKYLCEYGAFDFLKAKKSKKKKMKECYYYLYREEQLWNLALQGEIICWRRWIWFV